MRKLYGLWMPNLDGGCWVVDERGVPYHSEDQQVLAGMANNQRKRWGHNHVEARLMGPDGTPQEEALPADPSEVKPGFHCSTDYL